MADHTINVDIVDRSVPIGNHVNIAIVNKPNPVYNEAVNASELWYLINIPNYFITDTSTGKPINGTNYYEYFPEEGGGGGSITIDNFPTEGSENAVSSGGTYSFVNSSVSTNTANFIGTFSSVEDLEAYSGTVTNNDYAFVISIDENGNTKYDRYKYTDATNPASWEYEYTLNNSSFTAAEWATIQSGLTSTDKTKIDSAAGKKVGGVEFTIRGGTKVIAGAGAEQFNNYGTDQETDPNVNIASGQSSHAEGIGTTASGISAHAEGSNTTANGDNSHAEGCETKASSNYQHAEGKYNIEDSSGKYAHIIGNGTADDARSNAYAIGWDGKIYQPSDPNADPNGVYLSSKATKATTLSGYGITDAKFTPSTGTIQLGSNTLVPVTTIQINGTTQTNTNGTVNIPVASTSAYGATTLYNSINSTDTDKAATANAVKTAYDEGVAALEYSANTGVKNLFNFDNWEVVPVNASQGQGTATKTISGNAITIATDSAATSGAYSAFNVVGTNVYPMNAIVPTTPGKKYVFSTNITGLTSGTTASFLLVKNGDFASGSGSLGSVSITEDGLASKTFTAPNDCTFITFRIGVDTASTSATFTNIMVREEITDSSYQPYAPTNRTLFETLTAISEQEYQALTVKDKPIYFIYD